MALLTLGSVIVASAATVAPDLLLPGDSRADRVPEPVGIRTERGLDLEREVAFVYRAGMLEARIRDDTPREVRRQLSGHRVLFRCAYMALNGIRTVDQHVRWGRGARTARVDFADDLPRPPEFCSVRTRNLGRIIARAPLTRVNPADDR